MAARSAALIRSRGSGASGRRPGSWDGPPDNQHDADKHGVHRKPEGVNGIEIRSRAMPEQGNTEVGPGAVAPRWAWMTRDASRHDVGHSGG